MPAQILFAISTQQKIIFMSSDNLNVTQGRTSRLLLHILTVSAV